MRTFASLSAAAVAVAAKPRWNELEGYTFEQYQADHGKVYRTVEEAAHRKESFEKNMAKIRAVNAEPGTTWRAGVNKFTDWSEAEMKNYNKAKFEKHTELEKEFDKVHGAPPRDAPPMPRDVDWRNGGIVGPVRDQGQCGSCWAHSTAETISSYYNIQTNTTTMFSVGQTASCLPESAGNGCGGGLPVRAFKALRDLAANNKGPKILQTLTEEWTYPYSTEMYFWDMANATKDVNCKYEACHTKCQVLSDIWEGSPRTPVFNAAGVSGVGVVDSNHPQGTAAVMKTLADVGPLSIGVAAGDWYLYETGVFKNNATNGVRAEWQLDHAVVMAGYGYDEEADENFWLVKNSWSTGWGEGGYIRLWRAKDGEEEPCSPDGEAFGTSGCLSVPLIPTVFNARSKNQ